jgi:DNA mismatch endonuclease (patch repair protein)
MADIFSKKKRSSVMAAVRSRGNKSTEARLVALLREWKMRGWRRGSKLPGSPDFVFAGSRVAIFVDGCFWHGCPRHGHYPRSNAAFWRAKIERNRRRDRRVARALRRAGWSVMRIWEHALARKVEGTLRARLARLLVSRDDARPRAQSTWRVLR